MPAVSLLYLWQIDKAIGSVPVTLLMGCSLQLWVGTAAEDRAFHSDSTYKPRDTETAFDDMSCAGET